MTGVDALFARALALEDAGRLEEALEQYRAILAHEPGHEDAWHNHGLLLVRLGRVAEAERSHRDYVRACPRSMRARCDLADVLLALGRHEEVIAILDAPAEPVDAAALVRRGVALSCLRRFDDARAAFAAARAASQEAVARFLRFVAPGSDPDTMLSPENIFLGRAWIEQSRCDWSGWQGHVEEWRRLSGCSKAVVEPAVAFMTLHGPLTGAERHAVARGIAARIEARVPPMARPGPRARDRIRVGVLSPDFREHLNAYLLLPLFELADRSRFELHAYSLARDDGSSIRARVRSAVDGFHDLHALGDEEAAQRIRGNDIDLLLDVGGHTAGGRFGITARRPARVQALFLGFPGTLGSSRVDYAIVDRVVAPDAGEWAESLVYMPTTYYLYDFRQAVPRPPVSRADYGLPREGFVFCAFHKAQKITPDAFALWMEILSRVPRSVLWLMALDGQAAENLRAQASRHGVDPARLVFAPFDSRERYLARQRLGDLFLDAIHHSAMTTACDALAAGLPVLTVPGSAMASRAGKSLACAAGLPELVAPDPAAFVQLAVRLTASPEELARYRRRLEQRQGALFDTVGRVRELEQCFQEMIERHGRRMAL